MRNKYPGVCYRCGEIVGVGDGHFERIPGTGWKVQHAECAIRYRGTNTQPATGGVRAWRNPNITNAGLSLKDTSKVKPLMVKMN